MGVKPATILPEVDAARKFLMQVGYDPSFGARPLKRTIQKYVQDELAMQILSGTFQEGDQILVDTDPDTPALKFTKK